MADIFREVDEEVRRDRALQIWQRYGVLIVIAAVVLVAVAAGIVGWREWRHGQRAEASVKLQAAQRTAAAGDTKAAADQFGALAKDAGGGYRLLARFNEAGMRAQAGDAAQATATWESIVGDSGVPQLYRDLALLLRIENAADRDDPAPLLQRLGPLAADGNAWRFSARELQAALERRAGNDAKSTEILQRLAEDVETPAGIRARAGEMLGRPGQGLGFGGLGALTGLGG